MKKVLLFLLVIILALALFVTVSSLWNRNYYCNPCGKIWYNQSAFPDISNPFNEIHDGSYTISIDDDGNVLFKPIDGEEIKGKMTISPYYKYYSASIVVEFEDGETAEGICRINKDERFMSLRYKSKYYYFTDKRSLSKEEVKEYRLELIDFLSGVMETGEFPTQQEIKENSTYRYYTSYYQIDPGCGGPIVYDVCKKATVEKVDYANRSITITIDGVTKELLLTNETMAVYVNNGRFNMLNLSDLVVGECLVVTDNHTDDLVRLNQIFYFGSN